MKKTVSTLTALLLILLMTVSCGTGGTDTTAAPAPEPTAPLLNNVDISEYTIVYSKQEPDYNEHAAAYLQEAIKEKTGAELEIKTDAEAECPHEIIVGETSRPLSRSLDAKTEGLQFAFLSNEKSVAMEGDYFVIAAAAYYFAEAYITGDKFFADIPTEVTIASPITEVPNNYILLIGDGMGELQTRMLEYSHASLGKGDNDKMFYGLMLPHAGKVRTNSLSGTTDSAAAGTALATGYKTVNHYVGKDKDLNDVMSLTELATTISMSAGVMSTENLTGATPSAFTVHVKDRNDHADIRAAQALLTSVVLKTSTDSYLEKMNTQRIDDMLSQLGNNENGFFLMYEEAYIDKHGHDQNVERAQKTMYRFNQAIGQFMEYAFYNPDTLVIITADHETGNLSENSKGELVYKSDSHTGQDVPLFAYGRGAEIFNGITIENVQIPMTLAKMWGVNIFGDPTSPYKPLELK